MPYKQVLTPGFGYNFEWVSVNIEPSKNIAIWVGAGKANDTIKIFVKGPGIIDIPKNIKNVIIERFLGTNTLIIPKSVTALLVSSQTVKKYDINIPHTLKELRLHSTEKLESWFDISKLSNLKAFDYSQAPTVKHIGILPKSLEYLTLSNIGLKTFPTKLPVSIRGIHFKHFENSINFPDLSYLTKLRYIYLSTIAISKFSKYPPPVKTILEFADIPKGSAKVPDIYKQPPRSFLKLDTTSVVRTVVNGKVVRAK